MSKFIGTWADGRGFLATISQEGANLAVQYEPRANRPVFHGATETDPGIAAPVIKVNFHDEAPPFGGPQVGAVTESVDHIRRIFWSNGTTWHLVAPIVVVDFFFPDVAALVADPGA